MKKAIILIMLLLASPGWALNIVIDSRADIIQAILDYGSGEVLLMISKISGVSGKLIWSSTIGYPPYWDDPSYFFKNPNIPMKFDKKYNVIVVGLWAKTLEDTANIVVTKVQNSDGTLMWATDLPDEIATILNFETDKNGNVILSCWNWDYGAILLKINGTTGKILFIKRTLNAS